MKTKYSPPLIYSIWTKIIKTSKKRKSATASKQGNGYKQGMKSCQVKWSEVLKKEEDKGRNGNFAQSVDSNPVLFLEALNYQKSWAFSSKAPQLGRRKLGEYMRL